MSALPPGLQGIPLVQMAGKREGKTAKKGKQQRSQPSTHRESGGMVAVPYISVAAGALEHQGGFC